MPLALASWLCFCLVFDTFALGLIIYLIISKVKSMDRKVTIGFSGWSL